MSADVNVVESEQERLSLSKVARLIGVSLPSVWRWCLNGVRGRKLRSVHVGGRRYVLRDDLAEFLRAGDPSPSPTPSTLKRAESAERELERLGI